MSPEAGTWTAVFECPAGSSFNPHFHTGPGEYFLYKGRMDVRGGKASGGDTAVAPGYGFESSGARHDKTYSPVDSAFYMTFSGPLAFIQPDATVIANVGRESSSTARDPASIARPDRAERRRHHGGPGAAPGPPRQANAVKVCTWILASRTSSVSVAIATKGLASHTRLATSPHTVWRWILNAPKNPGWRSFRKASKN